MLIIVLAWNQFIPTIFPTDYQKYLSATVFAKTIITILNKTEQIILHYAGNYEKNTISKKQYDDQLCHRKQMKAKLKTV